MFFLTEAEAVSEEAVRAAVDFVKFSCQQTTYIAGRGPLQEEVERFKCDGKVSKSFVIFGWVEHMTLYTQSSLL